MKKKNIKKWIAGMMLPVTALGAMAGVIATDYVFETQNVVQAAAEKTYLVGGTQITKTPLYIFSMDQRFGFGGVTDTTYSLVKTYSSFDEITNKTYYGGYYDDGLFGSTMYYGWSYTNDSSTVTSWKESLAITVMVNDTMAPVMETQVFLADVDDPKELSYILSNYTFHDEVDGEIPITTDMIQTDNYTANKNKVGKWDVVVKATDKAGNTATGTIQVWVQDKTSPIITGPTTFTSNMSNPLTLQSILAQLSATDNVDGDISEKIHVASDGFTGKEQIVGNKNIVIDVTDEAGNKSVTTTLRVNCVDDIKPTITGTATYTTSYKVSIGDDVIKSAIDYNDNISSKDNMSLEEISDTYRGNQSIPGKYTRVFRVTDEAGNVSEVFSVEITVVDEIPPVFYAKRSIGVSQAQSLTHQDIVNILIYMEGLQNEGVAVNMIFNEYVPGEHNEPGVYRLSYRIMNSDGKIGEEQTATINVLGEKEVIENDEKTQIEQQTKNFFQKAWDSIKSFFSNIGKWIVRYLGFGWIWDKEEKFIPKW